MADEPIVRKLPFPPQEAAAPARPYPPPVLRPVARWRTWDEPDRDVAVAQWVERGVCVVFPRVWVAKHGQESMIAHAKDRIAAVEAMAGGRVLQPGSVLLAFTRHVGTIDPTISDEAMMRHLLTTRPREEIIDPDATRNILSTDPDHPLVDHP